MTCSYLNKIITIFKTRRIPCVVLLLLFLPAVVFGSIDNEETVVHQKKATIVYKAIGENSVVITEGSITAEHGKSIKLLPGTHLKGEQPVKASIVSRERQQALASRAEQQRQRKFFSTLFERLKNSEADAEGPKIIDIHLPLPGGGTSFWQQSLFAVAMPASSSSSFPAPFFVLREQITLQNIHDLRVTAFKKLFQPLFSWGNHPGNIKVLRC